jgi:hypothetical protein
MSFFCSDRVVSRNALEVEEHCMRRNDIAQSAISKPQCEVDIVEIIWEVKGHPAHLVECFCANGKASRSDTDAFSCDSAHVLGSGVVAVVAGEEVKGSVGISVADVLNAAVGKKESRADGAYPRFEGETNEFLYEILGNDFHIVVEQ